jgi:hypothetical protein
MLACRNAAINSVALRSFSITTFQEVQDARIMRQSVFAFHIFYMVNELFELNRQSAPEIQRKLRDIHGLEIIGATVWEMS